jgi:hypothetical protein
MKRLGVAGLLLTLACALPASATERDRVVRSRVIAPVNDQIVSGVVSVEGHASSAAGIRRVEIKLGDQTLTQFEPSRYRQEVPISFDWDTRRDVQTNELAVNGTYEITVVAVANGERNVDRETVSVRVDNTPAQPRGLQASVKGSSVSLEWRANNEPDLTKYVVQRNSGDGYENIAPTNAPAFSERLPAGNHSFRVVAVRASSVYQRGTASAPSLPLRLEIHNQQGREGSTGSSHSSVTGAPARPEAPAGGLEAEAGGVVDLLEGPSGAALLENWGKFKKRLPYDVPPELQLAGRPAGSQRGWGAVPPDGLRWIAAGALLLVVAAHTRFIATRFIATQLIKT